MAGFIDLHCHWIPSIDDGVRSIEAGIDLLRRLGQLGFATVVGTPHMRPGVYDNDRSRLEEAFGQMQPILREAGELPRTLLACEHFFDDVVYTRLREGLGVPYAGGGAALVEFRPDAFPLRAAHRLLDLRKSGITTVLAHPERYAPVWHDDTCLDPLLDAGVLLLLDVCALTGKYGRRAQRSAEKLLEEDTYEAACSDAHRPEDVDDVGRALERLRSLVGPEELERLFRKGPEAILAKAPTGSASKAASPPSPGPLSGHGSPSA